MDRNLIQDIANLIRQEGFTKIERCKSSRTQTILAQREDVQIIVHFVEGGEIATTVARVNPQLPKNLDVKIKASLPGLQVSTLQSEPSGMPAMQKLRQGSSSNRRSENNC